MCVTWYQVLGIAYQVWYGPFNQYRALYVRSLFSGGVEGPRTVARTGQVSVWRGSAWLGLAWLGLLRDYMLGLA